MSIVNIMAINKPKSIADRELEKDSPKPKKTKKKK